jgi:SAM-dependent methyltransferase
VPTREVQFRKLFEYVGGFQGTWVAVIGRKAGLFRVIHDAGAAVTADDLAKRLGYEPRYVRVWCRAAYAYELLDVDPAGGFRLAPHMAELLLDPRDPQYLGGRLELTVAFGEDFAAFPARLADGQPFPRKAHAPELTRGIMETSKPDFAIMTEIVLPHAPALLARLERGGGAILDVGCGAAYGLIHLSRRFPGARAVGLEVDPPMLELAARNLAEAGLGNRVRVAATSALAMEFVDEFDLAVMNIALHETGERPEWEEVLRRVRRALAPGGALLISELPYPGTIEEYREQPAYRMLAGIQHHEVLVGCGMITILELRALLEQAGFSSARRIEQPSPTRIMYLAER